MTLEFCFSSTSHSEFRFGEARGFKIFSFAFLAFACELFSCFENAGARQAQSAQARSQIIDHTAPPRPPLSLTRLTKLAGAAAHTGAPAPHSDSCHTVKPQRDRESPHHTHASKGVYPSTVSMKAQLKPPVSERPGTFHSRRAARQRSLVDYLSFFSSPSLCAAAAGPSSPDAHR